MGYDKRPWPGAPEAAWEAAAGAAPLAHGPVPDMVSSFERFTSRVVLENDRVFNGAMAVVVGAMAALGVVLLTRFRSRIGELGVLEAFFLGDVWYKNAFAFAAPVLVVGGVVRMLTAKRSHAARVRRLFEHARSNGVVAQAHATRLKVPYGEGDVVAVAMTVDSRTGDAQAGRLLRAAELWAEGLDGDEQARERFRRRMSIHITVRSEAVFGREATGGYLRTDRGAQAGPRWRLILPDPKDAGEPFGFWDVLKIEREGEEQDGPARP